MIDENYFLILLRVDPRKSNPLGPRRINEVSGPQGDEKAKGEGEQLIIGLINPENRATSTPIETVEVGGKEWLGQIRYQAYERAREKFKYLLEDFYGSGSAQGSGNVVSDFRKLMRERQDFMRLRIKEIGDAIQEIVCLETELGEWLHRFLVTAEDAQQKGRPPRHLTIITNDFQVPWFWLKIGQRLLCESCAVGMLQLGGTALKVQDPEFPDATGLAKCLLLKGSLGDRLSTFLNDEAEMIADSLMSVRSGSDVKDLDVQRVSSFDDLANLRRSCRKRDRRLRFRVVHYTGHWALPSRGGQGEEDVEGAMLRLDKDEIEVSELGDYVNQAALVLDGCSTSTGLDAWADTSQLTNEILNLGSLGCVVTLLPVRSDPIAAKVFWGKFYSELFCNDATLGQALVLARREIKRHFQEIGFINLNWYLYQLIGNPTVRLFR